MRIIPEWRQAWRFTSVQALVVLQVAPDLLRAFLDYAPMDTDLTLYRVALLIATVARFIYQPKLREATNHGDKNDET